MNYGMKIKRWWHSRMMWLNITNIVALAPLATIALGYIDVVGLEAELAAKIGMALNMFTGFCNLYLRKATTSAIGDEVLK
ncbi:MAG: hypothetical protein COB78_10745 [Hyphomicrobiales bacterium]|nr:MAG: hypothetical protein COB78_10745 [Hyphomicrobiales bacterium]